jgi:predicted alpha/beta superfamily hydrolase
MKLKIYTFVSLLLSVVAFAQVTLRVTAVPTNTPVGATIYLAGSINTWNPGNAAYALQADGFGAYQIVIPEGSGTVNYKFTRGSWPSVEGNASGSFLPDRSFTFTGSAQTITHTIHSWENLGGIGSNSTAAANVQVLNSAFFMPQLNTSRKVWLYLPPDYDTSEKNYPVLYMQDGQNLFDNATSFAGEWQIDETLNTLFSAGDYGAIVVGIDNGDGARLDEYSPWLNTQYDAGGDGDAYMTFIAETLKPYIDANFRTRTAPQFNALIGSSMGALISMYGACKYPDKFEKVGVFSPAFWFSLSDLNAYIVNDTTNINNLRVYFVAGQNESTTMVPNMNIVKNNLISEGVSLSNTFTEIDPTGTHSETFWRSEFGAAYQWLFAQTVLSINENAKNALEIRQLADGKVFIKGLKGETTFGIYSALGQRLGAMELRNGDNFMPSNLASGYYLLKAENGNVKPLKVFVK